MVRSLVYLNAQMYIFNGGKVFRLWLLRLRRGRTWGVRQSGHLSQDPVVVLKYRIHPQRVLKGVGGEGVPTRREGRVHNTSPITMEEGGGAGWGTTTTKQTWQHWNLHQGDGLPAAHALLVDENQDADDGAHQAQAPHQAGDDEGRVHRHGDQLAAALAVVVPVFTHRASGEETCSDGRHHLQETRSHVAVSISYSWSWRFLWKHLTWILTLGYLNNLISCKVMKRHSQRRVSHLQMWHQSKAANCTRNTSKGPKTKDEWIQTQNFYESMRSECYVIGSPIAPTLADAVVARLIERVVFFILQLKVQLLSGFSRKNKFSIEINFDFYLCFFWNNVKDAGTKLPQWKAYEWILIKFETGLPLPPTLIWL